MQHEHELSKLSASHMVFSLSALSLSLSLIERNEVTFERGSRESQYEQNGKVCLVQYAHLCACVIDATTCLFIETMYRVLI